MKNFKSRMIADGAVCTALTVLLTVMAIYIPIFSIASVAVVGIPLAYLGIKHGFGVSCVSAVTAVLVIFIITGDVLSAVLLGVTNMLPGIAVGYSINNKMSFKMSVITVSAGVLIGLMIHLVVINYSAGGNGIDKMIDETLATTKDMMSSLLEEFSGIASGQESDIFGTLNESIDLVREYIYLYIPSFVIGVSAVIGYIVYMFGVFVFKRLRVGNMEYLPFRKIYVTRGVCYGAVILMLITSFSESESVFMSSLKNIQALLYAFISVSGLAFIDYRFSMKIKSGYGRFAIYCLVFLLGYLGIGFIISILIFVGLLDGMFDYRCIGKSGDDDEKHK